MSDQVTSSDFTMVESEVINPAGRRPRLKWCAKLDKLFTDAVDRLGGPFYATPTAILGLMGVHRLDVTHIKSHLQMYRLQVGTEDNYVRQKHRRLAQVRVMPSGALKVRLPALPRSARGLPAPQRIGAVPVWNGVIQGDRFVPREDLRMPIQEAIRRYGLGNSAESSTVTEEVIDSNKADESEETSTNPELKLKVGGASVELVEKEEEAGPSSGERNVDLSLSLSPPEAGYPDLRKFK